MATIADQEITSFTAELRDFVRQEHEAARADLMKRWTGSIEERVAKGNAVAALTVIEVERSSRGIRVVLQCPANDSRYREGDYVKVTKNEPMESSALAEGQVSKLDDRTIELTCPKAHVSVGDADLTLDASSIDLRSFYDTAIDKVSQTAAGRERIIPLLLGQIEPMGASYEELRAAAEAFPKLNDSQAAAVAHASSTDLCYLVQGPPGTGKTKVLAAVVESLLAKKPNAAILITSFTHRAIDNALGRVVESGVAPGRVYKISSVPPTQDLPHALNIRETECLKTVGPLIVGATPFALKFRVPEIEFDWVIADEASQMTLPLAVMAMIAGRRWIFFGDDKQMPPVVLSLPAAKAVDQSVFGVLKRGGYNTELTTTYRLPAPLATWPSQQFYDRKLQPSEEAGKRRLRLSTMPLGLERILAPDPAAVFIRLNHSGATTSSVEEAEVIASIIGGLDSVGFPGTEIGVVVPYRRQARLIRTTLRHRGISTSMLDDVVADTVERMQGQERDIIIISLTTSDASFATQLADFLFQPERLNVAITRPKMKLIVVASSAWCDRFPREIPEANVTARFLETCSVVASPI